MQNFPVVFAFDVESDGPDPKRNNMLAVGWAVGEAEGTRILDRGWVALKPGMGGRVPDESTMHDFWGRYRGIYDMLISQAMEPDQAMRVFANALARTRATYARVHLACDCPAFDCLFLSTYLCEFGHPPIHILPGGGYAPIHDVDSYLRGMRRQSWDEAFADHGAHLGENVSAAFAVVQTHHPQDDAMAVYLQHQLCVMKDEETV